MIFQWHFIFSLWLFVACFSNAECSQSNLILLIDSSAALAMLKVGNTAGISQRKLSSAIDVIGGLGVKGSIS